MYNYEILEKKTEPFVPVQPRITSKDHKANLHTDPKVRLICPSKSDLGKLSKLILVKYISILRDNISLSFWLDSKDTISWFYNITDKANCKFLQFDIDNYYASIYPIVLNSALIFACKYTSLTRDEINVILSARKSLIAFDNKLWARNDTPDCLDITVESPDSTQVTDLVGIYLLYNLHKKIPRIVGRLYRDDALLLVRNHSNRQFEMTKKEIIEF